MPLKYQDPSKYIASYRIIREMATTSASRIFLAQKDGTSHSPVVIKLLFPMVLFSEQDKESFLQEASFLKQLQHPFISPILEVGVDKITPYIITAYAPGGSLRDSMQRQFPQPLLWMEALKILSQIGQALEYAHERNVIHCNLKPQNILFNARGEALLADFPFATLSTTRWGSSLTASGIAAYMAPEQFAGKINKECDQYALGCIAYEMFTGRPPFTTSYLSRLGLQHEEEIPPAPTSLNPLLPFSLEQAILQALAKEPAQRHSDIRAFLRALQASTQEQGQKHRWLRSSQPPMPLVVEAIHNSHYLSTATSPEASTISEVKKSRIQSVPAPILPPIEVEADPPLHQPATALAVLSIARPMDHFTEKSPLRKQFISLMSLPTQTGQVWINPPVLEKSFLPTITQTRIFPSSSLQKHAGQRKKRQIFAFTSLAVAIAIVGLLLTTSLFQTLSGIGRTPSVSSAPITHMSASAITPEPTQIKTNTPSPSPTPTSPAMAVAPPMPTLPPNPTNLLASARLVGSESHSIQPQKLLTEKLPLQVCCNTNNGSRHSGSYFLVCKQHRDSSKFSAIHWNS